MRRFSWEFQLTSGNFHVALAILIGYQDSIPQTLNPMNAQNY
jgi:hypothetical protein